ncbi:hypothetical protein ACP4OV_003272 [Aristida adscensionis]
MTSSASRSEAATDQLQPRLISLALSAHAHAGMRACLRASAVAVAVAGSAPAPAPAPAPVFSASVPGTAAGVGLGYGIAIAVGVLVLFSTVALASYLCVLTKAGAAHAAMLLADAPAPAPAAAVVQGLDGAAIDALYPKFLHAGSGDEEEGGAAGGPCAICLGEFAPGDALRRGAGCVHRFHAGCAERWLRVSATCPVCRDSPVLSPAATPLSEAVPLAAHAR